MQVFCAYKADPEDEAVKPGSFELAEVRVPRASQRYRVEIEVNRPYCWGRVTVKWDCESACFEETCVGEDGYEMDVVRQIDRGDSLTCVGLCSWDSDDLPDGVPDIADYLAWLDGNVELIEVDGRPFYVNPGKGAR